MEDYLKEYDYQIFVIEQGDDKSFNRGKLLNVGYEIASKNGCDYFVFHDVDMLPEDVDYSYSDKPLHLATHLQEHDYETTYFDYFGGVTLFNREDFEAINGYSNEYWGWGFEDDDLLVRCYQTNLPLDSEIQEMGNVNEIEIFNFSGDNSFIRVTSNENSTLMEGDFTISALVKPTNIQINPNSDYDEYPIVSIPGYNTGLFYNSFRRFFCQVYDQDKKPYSITTDILGERWSLLTMVYENQTLSLYLNAELVNSVELDSPIMKLDTRKVYVGTSSESEFKKSFFNGVISGIEIYDIALIKSEIKSIYNNPLKVKIRNFEDFRSSEFLYSQILPNLCNNEFGVDVSGLNKIELENVNIQKINQSFSTYLPKPYRRNSRFKSLKHKSNSSEGNRWIHKETRQNQIKYYNEVRRNFIDFHIDGINTLHYDLLEQENITDKTTKVTVNL
jgi:hypothetical protein